MRGGSRAHTPEQVGAAATPSPHGPLTVLAMSLKGSLFCAWCLFLFFLLLTWELTLVGSVPGPSSLKPCWP